MKFLCLTFVVGFLIADGVKVGRNAAIYRMPAEWEPHLRTFMVWPQYGQIWINDVLPETQAAVARIANTIAQFEPVVMLTGRAQVETARKQLNPQVQVIAMENDDLWARDTISTFVTKLENGTECTCGIDFNYNGYGNKKDYKKDAQLAGNVLKMLGLERITTEIITEGGALETDGRGTLLATKSSIANSNRNNETIHNIEVELKKRLGIKKIIWLDGVKGEEITDAHIDVLARFIRPRVVVISRPFEGTPRDIWHTNFNQMLSVLEKSTDAEGNRLKIIEISEPNPKKISFKGNMNGFCKSYVNFYIGNGFVAVTEFGDRESDLNAQKILREQFPGRVILPVQIDNIASASGGIHCTLHEQPV